MTPEALAPIVSTKLVRTTALLVSAALGAFDAANAAPLTYYTGVEALALSNVSFPDGQPSIAGSSIVLGPANNARGIMLSIDYPPNGTQLEGGVPAADINFELTRIACDTGVGCNGAGGPGANDHDPIFFVAVGTHAYAWQVADNSNGSVISGTLLLDDALDNTWIETAVERTGTSQFPPIGGRYNVDMRWIFFDDHVQSTINFYRPGQANIFSLQHRFDHFGGLDPRAGVRLGVLNEGNPGERYQVDALRIPAPASVPVPEPSTFALIGASLLGLRMSRNARRRQA